MTNLIAQLSIALVLTTNWTGHTFNGKELGYIATNHNAAIEYEGYAHNYTLKTTPSGIAVWREYPHANYWTTNIWFPPYQGWVWTNNIIVHP